MFDKALGVLLSFWSGLSNSYHPGGLKLCFLLNSATMDFLDFYVTLKGFRFNFVVESWVGFILERFYYLLFFGDLPSLCFV